MDVTFQNRGSNTLTGNFTITDVTFFQDALGKPQINTFAVSFEQHSEGVTPAVFGTFTYDAGRATAVPEPGTMALLCGLGFSSLLAVRRMRRNR